MPNLKLFGATRLEQKNHKCTYTWNVSNLKLLSEGNFSVIKSPQFLINNKEWYITLTPYLSEPYCFYLQLYKSNSNDTQNYQYIFSVHNENTEKFIARLFSCPALYLAASSKICMAFSTFMLLAM